MNIKKLNLHSQRSLFLLVLLTSIIISINGQGIVLDSENRYSKILDMLPISSDEYVIATKSSYEEGTNVKWYKANSVHKEHLIREEVDELNITLTEDGVLIDVTSSTFGCDVYFSAYRSFLLDTIQSESSFVLDIEESHIESNASIARLTNNNILLIEGYFEPAIARGIKLFNEDEVLLETEVPNDQMTNIAEIDDRVYIYGYEYILYTDIGGGDVDTIFFEGNQVLNIVATNEGDQIAILTWYGVYIKTIGSEEETYYPISTERARAIDIIYTDRLYLLRIDFDQQHSVVEIIDEEGKWERYAFIGHPNYEMDRLYDMGDQGIWITGQFIIPNVSGYPYFGSAIIDKLEDSSEIENDLNLEIFSIEGNGEKDVEYAFRITNNSNQDLENIKVYSTNLDAIDCYTQNLNYTIETLSAKSEIIVVTSVGLNFGTFEGTVCIYVLGSGENPDLEMEDNIACMQVTNTNELSLIKNQVVYPNPVSDRVYLKDFDIGEFIEILNLNGQVVLGQNYQNGIQVSALPSGVYYLRKESDKEEVYKFVKI